MRLTDADTCSYTSFPAWNSAVNNGTVTADVTGMTGGTYDGPASRPEENSYYAVYAAALVSGSFDGTGTGVTWTPLTKDGWSVTWEDLESGDYTVVIRDSADHENYITRPVTVENRKLYINTVIRPTSTAATSDGKIIVTTTGGITDTMETAIVKIPASYGTDPAMSLEEFLKRATSPGRRWTNPITGSGITFEDLGTGSLPLVRNVLADLNTPEIQRLKESLQRAEAALENASAQIRPPCRRPQTRRASL